jgi:hypothetical protein
MDKNIV